MPGRQTTPPMVPTPESTGLPNGQFFAQLGVDPSNHIGGVSSQHNGVVQEVVHGLFTESVLLKELAILRRTASHTNRPVCLEDSRHNYALDAFRGGTLVACDTFSDSVSGHPEDGNPRERKLRDYLIEGQPASPLPREARLRGHSVNRTEMAVAVMDPGLYTASDRLMTTLFEEAATALRGHIRGQRPVRYSQDLSDATRAILLAGGATQHTGETGNVEYWPKPFDEIAVLKGLVSAFGGPKHSKHSGFVRQGAVGVGQGENRIIVASSGQESGLDELVSRLVAASIISGKPFALKMLTN